MTDVVDAVLAEDQPMTERLGWCLDGHHTDCPAIIWPMQFPDPARKGATYTRPGRRCSCVCHTRPVL